MSDEQLRAAIEAAKGRIHASGTPAQEIVVVNLPRGDVECPSCHETWPIIVTAITHFGRYVCIACGSYFNHGQLTGHKMDEEMRQTIKSACDAGTAE